MTHISSPSDDDIAHICGLVRQAGQLASQMREGVSIHEKSGPDDRVTEADFAVSDLITADLRKRFPSDVVISEEDKSRQKCTAMDRIWLVDPIDGTHNYIKNDGQYSVMIGLLIQGRPTFGWVYAPASDMTYFGGPEYGAFRQCGRQAPNRYSSMAELSAMSRKRILMGFRDRKSHPWVMELSDVELIKSGSIGLKVAKVLDDEADIFVHLSRRLKVWDTAGPMAIAYGAGLDVGQLAGDEIPFRLPLIRQECSIIIGRPGALFWSRTHLIKT